MKYSFLSSISLSISILFISTIPTTWADHAHCYYPDGELTPLWDLNSYPCAEGAVMCCPRGTRCLNNRACEWIDKTQPKGRILFRASCTDTSFNDPECFKGCGELGSDIALTECSDGTVCCGAENESCCAQKEGKSLSVIPRPSPIQTSSSQILLSRFGGRSSTLQTLTSISSKTSSLPDVTVTITRSRTVQSLPTSSTDSLGRWVMTTTLNSDDDDSNPLSTAIQSQATDRNIQLRPERFDPSVTPDEASETIATVPPTTSAQSSPDTENLDSNNQHTTRVAIGVSVASVSAILASLGVFFLYRRRKRQQDERLRRQSVGLMKFIVTSPPPTPGPALEVATTMKINRGFKLNMFSLHKKKHRHSKYTDPRLKPLNLQAYAYDYSNIDLEKEDYGLYELSASRMSSRTTSRMSDRVPSRASEKAPEVYERAPSSASARAPEVVADRAPSSASARAPEAATDRAPSSASERAPEKAPAPSQTSASAPNSTSIKLPRKNRPKSNNHLKPPPHTYVAYKPHFLRPPKVGRPKSHVDVHELQ